MVKVKIFIESHRLKKLIILPNNFAMLVSIATEGWLVSKITRAVL